MTSNTQTKKELIHGLKTNCKKGYNLLAETQAELTATQKWIIDKLLPYGDCSYHRREDHYDELTRFLTDLNISIKVPMLTVMTPYTNKKGKTTMKHYTANGFMVNDLKDDKPVLYPTWIKFNDRTLLTNNKGHPTEIYFNSFADQTVYTLAPPRVVVELVVEEEEEEEEKEEVEYHFCGVTGGENDDIECCRKKVIAEDTCMIGNTSYCIECFEKHEENEEEEEEEVCPLCGILPTTCDCDKCGEVGCYECITTIDEDEYCHDCAEEEEEVAPKVIGDLITGKITVAVLTNYCRENKFKGHTKMKKKEDLIAFILKQ